MVGLKCGGLLKGFWSLKLKAKGICTCQIWNIGRKQKYKTKKVLESERSTQKLDGDSPIRVDLSQVGAEMARHGKLGSVVSRTIFLFSHCPAVGGCAYSRHQSMPTRD